MKKAAWLILIFSLFITSCEKNKTMRKLSGEWDIYEYKKDGNNIDVTNIGTRLVFKSSQLGEVYKFPVNGGWSKKSNFTFQYLKKENILKFYYDNKFYEDFEIIKLRASSGIITYAEEEDAPAEFLKLKKGNEEFYFEKVK